MYDLIIRNGTLIDGTGSEPYSADIGIRNGKIQSIGKNLNDAARIIDATGLTVTPGFIDSHSHSDNAFLSFPDQKEKIEQGITTCICGQCGSSPAPAKKADTQEFYTMGAFLKEAQQVPQGCNAMVFAGHSAIRTAAMSKESRKPTPEEMDKMKALLTEAMEAGALGISFGLAYAPSCFADTEELIELATVAKEHGGMVSAHLRNESDHVIQATAEFIEILRKSGAKGVYSHHKSTLKRNWGKVQTTLSMLDKAVSEGIEIYSDAYPYTATSTSLGAAFIPKKYRGGEFSEIVKRLADPQLRQLMTEENQRVFGDDLSWVLMTFCNNHHEYDGLRIPEIAELRHQSQYDTVYDLITECRPSSACYFSLCEEDVKRVLSHPRTMVCTDASVVKSNTVYHPRLRGSFPRVLGRYVREGQITSLQEMIRKMTSLPAEVYGLNSKGKLQEGYDADICIFNAQTIIDHASFTDCSAKCEGLHYVIINGEIAAVDAMHTGTRSGKIILRK